MATVCVVRIHLIYVLAVHGRLVTHCNELLQLVCCVAIAVVESVWSGVVSGTQPAVLPAYRPLFRPVPLLHSTSNIDVLPSTPPSKHFSQGSPSLSSRRLSHKGVSREQDRAEHHCDQRHLSPAYHCPAADGTLQREESHDSGGEFLTPTSSSSSHVGLCLESQLTAVCRKSSSSSSDLPATSLVDVGRKFGRSGDNSDVEYRGKHHGAVFISRNSSPGDFETVAEAADVSAHEHSANDVPAVVHVRSNSCFGVLYHRSDEPFVAPSKPKKKSKKPRRNSQPGQSSCSSAKSMAVHGGNPKWIWKS